MSEDTAAPSAEAPAQTEASQPATDPAPAHEAESRPPAPIFGTPSPEAAPPDIIVIDDEPNAGDAVIVKSSAPAQEPAGAPVASDADPWGLAKHEAHKMATARDLPPLPDLPSDRELSFDEFRVLFADRAEAFVRSGYQDYLEHHPHAKDAG